MYQKLILIGNLGRDPECAIPPKKPMTNFSMATSRKFGDRDETTWFRVTVFGRQAEACNQYLRKGSKVLVEGRLYTDGSSNPNVFQRKDGTYGASYEVTAETVRFLSHAVRCQFRLRSMDDDEDIPF